MKSKKISETFFCVFLLIFLTFLFSPQPAAATNCVCAGGSPIPGYYPTIGAATTVSDDGACDQECANRSAKYYSYSNLGNIGFTRVTKTAISTTAANASPSAATGNFNYQPMEKIPGFETTADIGNFYVYVSVIYKFGIWAVGIAALLMITIGGFMYITSAGNNASMEKAKGVITDAIVGLLLALTSWLILYTINPSLVTISPLAPAPITITPTLLPTTLIGTGKCKEAASGSYCYTGNLKVVSACFKTDLVAYKASTICMAESGGSVGSEGDYCVHNGAHDPFSIGLFQINLIANGWRISSDCDGKALFNTYNGGLQGTNLGGGKYDCEVKPEARSKYEACKLKLKNPVINDSIACKISSLGANWGQWSANKKCGY